MNRALIEETARLRLEDELTLERVQAATSESDTEQVRIKDAEPAGSDTLEKEPFAPAESRFLAILHRATWPLRGLERFFTGRVDEERLTRHDSQLEIYSIKGMFR